jgi:hypothetical protein
LANKQQNIREETGIHMHNRQTSLRMSDLVKMIFGAFLNGGQIAKVPP